MPFNKSQKRKINRKEAARVKKQNNRTRRHRFPDPPAEDFVPLQWPPPAEPVRIINRKGPRPPILQSVFFAAILSMRRGIDFASVVKADPELQKSLGITGINFTVPKFGNGSASLRGSLGKLLANDKFIRAEQKAKSHNVSNQAESLLKRMCSMNNKEAQCLHPKIQEFAIDLLRRVEEKNLPAKAPDNNVCRMSSMCMPTLGIPRDLMPVINNASDFLRRINEEGGITHVMTMARPSDLYPAQGEIRESRAVGAMKDMDSKGILQIRNETGMFRAADPILISQDNWIIDGHHRWVAAQKRGLEDIPIPVIRIMAPFIEVMYYARNETTQAF
jgi:hypothetical protein